VSWHATPFEERLEKALSEEGGQGFIPPRYMSLFPYTVIRDCLCFCQITFKLFWDLKIVTNDA